MSVVDFPSQGALVADLQPKRLDLLIYRGDTFNLEMILKNDGEAIDVTGWSGRAKVVSPGSDIEVPLTVQVGSTNGKIVVSLNKASTSSLVRGVNYKYDVEVEDANENVRTVVSGKITVTEDVTK